MIELVRAALAVLPGRTAGPLFFPDEHPNDAMNKRWRAKGVTTGKPLRDTYISIAALIGTDPVHRELLVDHRLPGLPGVYIEERLQWDALLVAQKIISAAILRLCAATI